MRRGRGRLGFTLIELLVVIGIIAVLIAILIPVVGRVRLAAQTANTTNQMHRISAAIQVYFNDFLAYPGVFTNKEFTPAGSLNAKLGNTSGSFTNFANYTQSEDMAMALLGGFEIDTSGKFDLVSNEVGMGPISFNTVQVLPRKNAYIDRRPEDFTPLQGGKLVQIKAVTELGLTYINDSEAPEFMDLYATPRPILYMRANAGAVNNANNIFYNSRVTNTFRADICYDIGVIQPYLKSTPNVPNDFHNPADASSGGDGFTAGNLDVSKQWVKDYFTSKGTSGTGNTAKNAGSFMLIDAGPDRLFGTADDIIVGAGGGQ
jgi:prepilin-type N-terminal cleavage/methylation domain-containing protein